MCVPSKMHDRNCRGGRLHPGPTPDRRPPPLPALPPSPMSRSIPQWQDAPNPPCSLFRHNSLLCMAREEERRQESNEREAGGENETNNKISVLTFIAFLPRPPLQLIVNNNQWPHHDRGHGVARGQGEGWNSDGAEAAWMAQTQLAPFALSTWQRRRRRGRRAPLAPSARRRQGRRGRCAPPAPLAQTAHSSSRSLGVGAAGTVYLGALPPLRRHGGDGHSVVWEKGRETRKGKLEGEGMEKKRCGKMRAATGSNVKSMFVAAVFMTSVL